MAKMGSRVLRLERLRHQLEVERSSFIDHWRTLSEHVMPRRSRFFITDVNNGERRNDKINDTTATMSLRTLRSGMMGGITSPSRPWFRLGLQDKELENNSTVKDWLDLVGKRINAVYLKSNLYKVLPIIYGDMGLYGTGCVVVEEDFNEVIRFIPIPIGSYSLSTDKNLKVNMFYREFQMTVRQIVEKFGMIPDSDDINWENISSHVKDLYDKDQTEDYIDIYHYIGPNEFWDSRKEGSKYKKFASIYYERGQSGSNSADRSSAGFGAALQDHEGRRLLSEKGYDFFPVLSPRWETTGEDVYGTHCPGMVALPDIKQLQLGEMRGLQAIEKMVNPPMIAPISMENKKISIIPGDITYADIREGMQGIRSAHDINFRVDLLEQKQAQVRQRIQRAFFEDLFLMLTETDRRQITATEVIERKEEKLLALGPVLEQLNQDLLDPLIDITFDIMQRQRLLPPPPEELQGQDLKIEYISIMAQAQKLAGLGNIERLTTFVGNLAAATGPQTLDKLDIDETIDIYADVVGAPNGMIRSDEDVEALREQKAQAQQAAEQQQQLASMAGVAKDLSQADTSGDNALNEMLQQSEAGSLL